MRDVLMEAFPAQFGACLELFDFVRANQPAGPPTDDAAGQLILWTFARSTKTYGACVRLAGAGYGEQAVMLDRSLFEDVLIAHWVKRHPNETIERFDAHSRYIRAKRAKTLREVGVTDSAAAFELPPNELRELGKRFARGTWTGLTLRQIIDDVRCEWLDSPVDQRVFDEMTSVVYDFNNLVLHHGAVGLTIAGSRDEAQDTVQFGVGPSQYLLAAALTGAYWSYANLYSLVVAAEADKEFGGLYARGMQTAFMEARSDGAGQ